MANDNDVATLAESFSEIREAIERVATAIRIKDSSTVVIVNGNELTTAPSDSMASSLPPVAPSAQEISQETERESPASAVAPANVVDAIQSEVPPTTDENPVPFEQFPPGKGVRARRVEHQILVRDPDGGRWLITTRSYSDEVFRQDRKPYKSPGTRL